MKEEVKDDFMVSLEGLSLEQQIDKLGQEILANSFLVIERMRNRKGKVTEREIKNQEEMVRQFKTIQSVYISLKKMNRVQNNPNNNFEEGLRQRMKEKESSMGNIVAKIDK